jgi:hypothetical protein
MLRLGLSDPNLYLNALSACLLSSLFVVEVRLHLHQHPRVNKISNTMYFKTWCSMSQVVKRHSEAGPRFMLSLAYPFGGLLRPLKSRAVICAELTAVLDSVVISISSSLDFDSGDFRPDKQ